MAENSIGEKTHVYFGLRRKGVEKTSPEAVRRKTADPQARPYS
jgi:hypothetical protein